MVIWLGCCEDGEGMITIGRSSVYLHKTALTLISQGIREKDKNNSLRLIVIPENRLNITHDIY